MANQLCWQSPRKKRDDVIVGNEGPDWMRGGSYLVARRIRIALEHWDRTKVDFQEQTVGRHKASGAPLGMKSEFEPLDLDATETDGKLMIPESAHVRLAAAASNGGRICRCRRLCCRPAFLLANIFGAEQHIAVLLDQRRHQIVDRLEIVGLGVPIGELQAAWNRFAADHALIRSLCAVAWAADSPTQ
jgi:hypothetical protein